MILITHWLYHEVKSFIAILGFFVIIWIDLLYSEISPDVGGLGFPNDPITIIFFVSIITIITTTIIITTIITNITIIITSPASLLLNCWWLSSVVPSWTKWPPGSKPLPGENNFQISFNIAVIPVHTIHYCVFVFTDDQSNIICNLHL